MRDELRFMLRAGDAEYVYFVEFRGRGTFLRASPIDVSKIVREFLFERMRTTVLTSATLTVDGRFDYIRNRLGIGTASEIRLPSEFDFSKQAILYLPRQMPDPRSPEFALAAGREVVEILRRSRGRAFVLFTSYATLREVQAIAEMALDYPIFVQGTAPRSQLLRQFRETPHSVLLATSSFWQGVDVVGDALSCVIIDKLPFASPADPITAARIEAIRSAGRRPVRRISGAAGDSDSAAGAGQAHPSPAGPRGPVDPRSRGSEPRATAAVFWRRCRPPRSCTTCRASKRFFQTEVNYPHTRVVVVIVRRHTWSADNPGDAALFCARYWRPWRSRCQRPPKGSFKARCWIPRGSRSKAPPSASNRKARIANST